MPWTSLKDKDIAAFASNRLGAVIGGTAWDFSNSARVPRRALDLLVIDEAGQYSLANTVAAAVSARRLLLLGDPQQLPQVSQGTHPEPVDTSALGWLNDGHSVLPAEFGYFLPTTWRMHPAVCAPVSALSYEGRLRSRASGRNLAGIEPGLHAVPVAHIRELHLLGRGSGCGSRHAHRAARPRLDRRGVDRSAGLRATSSSSLRTTPRSS